MSILHGSISKDILFAENFPYGKEMELVSIIDKSAVTIAALNTNTVVCAGETLSVYKISEDGSYEIISSVNLPGKARQISIYNGFAYISARENGVIICDLTAPQTPAVIHKIDTAELATGISVADEILAVTNRHMGCEIFDISNPSTPKRLCHFMCGEAQSVALFEKYAIIGDWMNKRARLFDISDTSDVKEISNFNVDGFADGVCAFKYKGRNICAVATGHHSSKLKNRWKYNNYTYMTPEMLQDGYGCGHGIEIFDITDPSSPEWISGIKTPPLFGGIDTWLVFTDGSHIIFTDSANGIFVITIEDIFSPKSIRYYKLPVVSGQRIKPPSIQVISGAVTGAALVNGFLCISSEQCGVYILKKDIDLMPFLPQKLTLTARKPKTELQSTFFKSESQIHSFVEYNNKIYCAAGEEGIIVLDTDGKLLFKKDVKNSVYDLQFINDKLISAEGTEGFAIYTPDNLNEISRFKKDKICARQVVSTLSGFAIQSGLSDILLFSQNDNSEFTLDYECKIPGILYHRHLSRTLCDGKIVALPLSVGPVVISPNGNNVEQNIVFNTEFCPFSDGACGYDDKMIAIHSGQYFCINTQTTHKSISTKQDKLYDGQPFIIDNKLILINRYSRKVTIFEISDINNPVYIKTVLTPGYPEFCNKIKNDIYVSCGYNGIIKL